MNICIEQYKTLTRGNLKNVELRWNSPILKAQKLLT